jgi:hypothetical protein
MGYGYLNRRLMSIIAIIVADLLCPRAPRSSRDPPAATNERAFYDSNNKFVAFLFFRFLHVATVRTA